MKKENYGFLRMRGGGKMLFFHTNNITIEGRPMFLRREESLSEAVPVGQEVEFWLIGRFGAPVRRLTQILDPRPETLDPRHQNLEICVWGKKNCIL